jgi:hypothetical protein
VDRSDEVNVIDTPGEFIGFSLLFVLIGAILAFVAALIAGRFGYIIGENEGRETDNFLEETIRNLRKNK